MTGGFWGGADNRVKAVTRENAKPYNAKVIEVVGSKARVALPGESTDPAVNRRPAYPVIGATPTVGQTVLVLANFAGGWIITSGGSGGSHTILSATHTDADETKTPIGGDLFKFVGGVWVPGRAVWGEIQDKPATFPPSAHGHNLATTTADGFMAGADKGKLDGLTGQAVGAFHAHKSVDQNDLPANTFTKVTYEAEKFDVSAWFDTANSRYVPQRAGYYRFNSTFGATSTADGYVFALALFRNGAQVARLVNAHSGSTAPVVASGAGIAYANGTTDYFEIYFLHNVPASGTALPDLGAGAGALDAVQIFQGEYIGSA